MESLKNSQAAISTAERSPLTDLSAVRALCSDHVETLRRQMDTLDLMMQSLLPASYASFQRIELAKLRLVCDRLRDQPLASTVRLEEVAVRAAVEQFQFMIGFCVETETEIHRSPSSREKEVLFLLKRLFVFHRIITEIVEGIQNIKYTDPSDLYLQPIDSADWELVRHFTFDIEPDSRDNCLEIYSERLIQAMAVLASIGKAAGRIPRTHPEMERIISEYALYPKKIHAAPLEFTDFINLKDRENCDKLSAKFFLRATRYLTNKKLCLVDGNFMIAQADYRVFKKFLHMTDKAPVRFLRAKLEYPHIEYNLKFYLSPTFLERYFLDDGYHPVKLMTDRIVLTADELLSTDLTEKKPDAFSVRFFCDIHIKHFANRFYSIKNHRTSRFSPIKENHQFDWAGIGLSSGLSYQNSQPQFHNGLGLSSPVSITSSAEVLKDWLPEGVAHTFDVILVYIHGGGFAAMSSSSHQNYLRVWSKELKIPIFSIDYRLAPDAQYPQLFNDVIRGYIWILAFVSEVLRVNPKRIILSGDSAGGNLAAVLTTWCIENRVRVPDNLIMHYPATDLTTRRFTPSFVYAFSDFLLNYSALRMCSSYYLPPWADSRKDYYISPVVTPPHILARYPPTAVFCCERDPLSDDAFRFAHRMLVAGAKVQVYRFRHVCHGLLNFAIDNFIGMPHARRYEQSARELIRQLITSH